MEQEKEKGMEMIKSMMKTMKQAENKETILNFEI
jgi:hypothetical protein